MKEKLPRRSDLRLICTIILATALIIPVPRIFMGGNLLGQGISIQDALKDNRVDAWAESIGMGFRQPMMLLHIVAKNEIPIAIRIPLGTRIVSTDSQYSDLVVASNFEVPLTLQADVPLSAFGLSFNLRLPSAAGKNAYKIGEVVAGKLMELLRAIDELHGYTRYGAQLAVWSLYPDPPVPIDQMTGKVQGKPEDIQDADHWLALSQASQPGGGLKLGIVLIAILGFAALAAAGFSLMDANRARQAQAMKSNPPAFSESPQTPSTDAGLQTEKPASLLLGIAAMKEQEDPSIKGAQQLVRLNGISGTFAGRGFDLELSCLLSRGAVEWLAVEDGAVSSPHALFDFSSMPFRVKDLNSSNGLRIGDQLVERFINFYLGDKIFIGKQTLVVNNDGMKIIAGSRSGQCFVHTLEPIGITHEKFHVVILGPDDMRISDAHAILRQQEGMLFIKDLRSSNGTFVNGQRIEAETPLKNGDHIGLGDSEFEIKIP